MAEPMLSVYNINVWYGAIHAIKDISFNVNEGEIVALIGANGAGKSTTAQDRLGPAALQDRLHQVYGRGHYPYAR